MNLWRELDKPTSHRLVYRSNGVTTVKTSLHPLLVVIHHLVMLIVCLVHPHTELVPEAFMINQMTLGVLLLSIVCFLRECIVRVLLAVM